MDNTIKQQWVEALHSGSYQQNVGSLHRGSLFCVNGVLCDLYLKAHNMSWASDGNVNDYFYVDEFAFTVPDCVIQWAGLNNRDPLWNYGLNELSADNDRGMTFTQLAHFIEEMY